MPQKRKHTPSTQQSKPREHISQTSITRLIVRRYLSAMNLFYVWRKARGLEAKPKYPELDRQLGNYLIFYSRGISRYIWGLTA